MPTKATVTNKLYDILVQTKGERISNGIRESAVDDVPGNFLRLLFSTVLTKMGDALSKPGVLITWMLGTLGAPAMIIGLVVPVREAGSLILQLFVGEAVQQREIRKYFWVAGSLAQGVAILGMVPVLLYLRGATAGWTIIALLAVFSLARGVCSVVSKDLVGRTVPKTRRGRLGGIADSVAGVIAIGVAVWLLFYKGEQIAPSVFAVILGVAGCLWLIAAGLMVSLKEPKAEAAKSGNPLREIKDSLQLLRTDPDFRLFCISRALLAGTALSMPFYVILAREATDGSSQTLGLLLIGGSVATAISGVIWGRFADYSSRLTLATAGIAAGAIGCATALFSDMEMSKAGAIWFYGGLFFLIGLAHTGIRLGRKTHLIDMSNETNRASMVAVSNTLIGVVLLLSSAFGFLAGVIGERMIILVFAGVGLAGGLLALKLPEVQETDH